MINSNTRHQHCFQGDIEEASICGSLLFVLHQRKFQTQQEKESAAESVKKRTQSSFDGFVVQFKLAMYFESRGILFRVSLSKLYKHGHSFLGL